MKKATRQKEAAPVNLGTKRNCPSCNIKFYDFGKPEVVCPKCQAKLDEAALNPVAKLAQAKKARPVVDEETPAVATDSEDVIESVDDLGDDEDEELVDDLVDEDEEQESY